MLHRVGNAGWIVNNGIYRSLSTWSRTGQLPSSLRCARHHGHGTTGAPAANTAVPVNVRRM